MCVLVTQLRVTLCDPLGCSLPGSLDYSPPGSSVHGILFMGFSKQEYWSRLPSLPPGDLPNPGIEPMSPVSLALQVDSLPAEPSGKSLYDTLTNSLVLSIHLRSRNEE